MATEPCASRGALATPSTDPPGFRRPQSRAPLEARWQRRQLTHEHRRPPSRERAEALWQRRQPTPGDSDGYVSKGRKKLLSVGAFSPPLLRNQRGGSMTHESNTPDHALVGTKTPRELQEAT